MINLNHLYYFYQTAKQGGVTKAAKILRISQPSLSAQLKTFEQVLEKKLFRRVGRNLDLTPDGVITLNYAKKIFEIVDDYESLWTRKTKKQDKSPFRVGVAREVERSFISSVLTKLVIKKTTNETPVILNTGEHPTLMEQLHYDEIDALITSTPVFSERIKTYGSFSIPVVPIISPSLLSTLKYHPKHTFKKFCSINDFFFVLPTKRSKLRLETNIFIEKNVLAQDVILQSDTISAVIRSVLEGVQSIF